MTVKPRFDNIINLSIPPLKSYTTDQLGTKPVQLIFSPEFSHLLLEDETLSAQLITTLQYSYSAQLGDFRRQVIFKATPFLIGFFPSRSEIRFYSQRLNRELYLCKIFLGENGIEAAKQRLAELEKHSSLLAELEQGSFPTIWEQVSYKEGFPNIQEIENDISDRMAYLRERLLKRLHAYTPSLFEKATDWGLGLTASYALIRIHLLKFIAILPELSFDSGAEIKKVLLESLRRLLSDSDRATLVMAHGQSRPLPSWMYALMSLALNISKFIPALLLAKLIRFSIELMAKRFIAGESIEKASKSFRALYSTHRDVTLDQLGELVVSEAEADQYMEKVITLITGFKKHLAKGEVNKAGINRAHVSIKVSALCSDFRAEAFDATYQLVAPRLIKILQRAHENDVFINIDAEHIHYRQLVLDIYSKALKETQVLQDFQATGIVIQAYLRDAAVHTKEILELAKARGIRMPVRLVKGAYWDAETIEATAHSHRAPQFLNKEETDLNFRAIINLILSEYKHLRLCLASHNYEDHIFAEALRDQYYPSAGEIEHQCLHMTYEALSISLGEMGWPTRNYVPVGSLIVGMAYLVRRIMENSSQVGVLTIMRSHKEGAKRVSSFDAHMEKKKSDLIEWDQVANQLKSSFFNIAPIRIYYPEELKEVKFQREIFKKNLGKTYAAHPLLNGENHSILSPNDPSIKVGDIKFASLDDVSHAVQILENHYTHGEWPRAPWQIRSAVLLQAAQLTLASRHSISQLMSHESGKTLPESYGDVDEAIDFLNFYAREAALGKNKNMAPESRGVIAVVSPWNFPFAIPCGMVCAALVTGNTVALKSAEQTPLLCQVLVEILHQAGVPQEALIHLPGQGETIGDALVNKKEVAGIIFTGSKNVGLMIAKNASKRVVNHKNSQESFPVKVITEMGGKNCIIVSANAELDEAVDGIIYSAMAHAGQKCSAASRVLIDERVFAKLARRLKEALNDIKIGPGTDLATYLNPVITKEDQLRLQKQVNEASKEATDHGGIIHVNRSVTKGRGYHIGPTLIELPYEQALKKESFAMKELFGPVVHIIPFKKLEDALKLFNKSEYALTGGVFSQSQDDIDYLSSQMECGNIYINRAITGARVAIEPFGGFKLSGTGPKAGSPFYIKALQLNRPHLPFHKSLISFASPEDEGSHSIMTLAIRSPLEHRAQRMRIITALDKLIGRFNSLYKGIYEVDLEILEGLRTYLDESLHQFLSGQHSNLLIPGQTNYNSFAQTQEHLLVIVFEKRAYLTSLIQTICALALGTAVTVVARNHESYSWWKALQNIFTDRGISPETFQVYHGTQKATEELISHKTIQSILLDGPIEMTANYMACAYPEVTLSLKRFLTPRDAPAPHDYQAYLLNLVNMRSFAVNTMKHGAPLELDF